MAVGSENLVAMLNPIGESAQLVDSVVDVESSRTPSRRRVVDFQLGNDAQKAAEVGVSNNVSETIVISEDDDDEPTDPEIAIVVEKGEGRYKNRKGKEKAIGSRQLLDALPKTPRLRRATSRAENEVALSPGFRSVAAMAGWDDEALLLAAIGQESPLRLIKGVRVQGTPEPSRHERKRGVRTPGQAVTPLSAARRRRRLRRQARNETTVTPIPMALLNAEPDKNGGSSEQSASQISECKAQNVTAGAQQKPNPDRRESSKNPKGQDVEEQSTRDSGVRLEQLQEELTCVVCLEICLEPSTTSCGHSFCKGCLQSVLQKCGLRCPKCRQPLRGSCATDCPINTVLWNTIQLLFPREAADRIKEQKSRELEEKKLTDATGKPTVKNLQHPTGFVRRTLRPVPWRQLPTSNTNNLDGARPISSNGSFQRASTILRSLQTAAHVVEPTNGLFGSRVQQQRGGSGNTWPRRQAAAAISRQEQEDAALAARLQESFI
ncbi:hypothetical protein BDL97_19G003100 [Sphagnum fallax]|nr:hypothetical protein BDL97_19G003100 [Sphagnum fallax]